MSDTTKTVLIVGGVAVGAFVLLRMLAPPAVRPQQSSGGGIGSFINGIVSAIPAVAGAFASNNVGRPTSGAPSVGYEAGESFDDFYTGMFGPGSLDVAGG